MNNESMNVIQEHGQNQFSVTGSEESYMCCGPIIRFKKEDMAFDIEDAAGQGTERLCRGWNASRRWLKHRGEHMICTAGGYVACFLFSDLKRTFT